MVEKLVKIAAILVEPAMGVAEVIPPITGYLKKLRQLANKYQTLLIFDEVQTLRLDEGDAQKKFDVIPDLTAMGGNYRWWISSWYIWLQGRDYGYIRS